MNRFSIVLCKRGYTVYTRLPVFYGIILWRSTAVAPFPFHSVYAYPSFLLHYYFRFTILYFEKYTCSFTTFLVYTVCAMTNATVSKNECTFRRKWLADNIGMSTVHVNNSVCYFTRQRVTVARRGYLATTCMALQIAIILPDSQGSLDACCIAVCDCRLKCLTSRYSARDANKATARGQG